MIKAITGIRRVGKSFFIRQLMESLRKKGVPEWERTVAAWSGDAERFDVTITGSNSTLFSGGLATKLTGRYIEFPIYPLSFPEFQTFFRNQTRSEDNRFTQYLRYGGMPGIHILEKLEDETVMPYLDAIYNTILLKDCVDRHQIINTALLYNLGRHTFDNIGNLLSANRISTYLKSQRIAVNVQSVVNYLAVMTDAQLFFRVPRYDIKGKRHLDAKTVIARETAPLLAIGDNHPKTIITLDSMHADSIEGINIISLKDFLSEKK